MSWCFHCIVPSVLNIVLRAIKIEFTQFISLLMRGPIQNPTCFNNRWDSLLGGCEAKSFRSPEDEELLWVGTEPEVVRSPSGVAACTSGFSVFSLGFMMTLRTSFNLRHWHSQFLFGYDNYLFTINCELFKTFA